MRTHISSEHLSNTTKVIFKNIHVYVLRQYIPIPPFSSYTPYPLSFVLFPFEFGSPPKDIEHASAVAFAKVKKIKDCFDGLIMYERKRLSEIYEANVFKYDSVKAL